MSQPQWSKMSSFFGSIPLRSRVSHDRSHPTSDRIARDSRIDLVRGLALWMIFTDHIIQNPIAKITYKNVGFSDATEIFVFLSGLSCGILYLQHLRSVGIGGCILRSAYRIFQIYVAYVAVGCLSFVIVLAARDVLPADVAGRMGFDVLLAHPDLALVDLVALRSAPFITDILTVYLALMALVPALALGITHYPRMTLLASAAVWALTIDPGLPLADATIARGLNPFSWQFLFCLGFWAAKRFYVDGVSLVLDRRFYCFAWAVIIFGLAVGLFRIIGHHSAGAIDVAWLDLFSRGMVESGDLAVLRLSHFLAVAYLTAIHLRWDAGLLRLPIAQPLVACGRHSLEVFSVTVVLSIIGSIIFLSHAVSVAEALAWNAAGWAILASFAWLLTSVRELNPAQPSSKGVDRVPPAPVLSSR